MAAISTSAALADGLCLASGSAQQRPALLRDAHARISTFLGAAPCVSGHRAQTRTVFMAAMASLHAPASLAQARASVLNPVVAILHDPTRVAAPVRFTLAGRSRQRPRPLAFTAPQPGTERRGVLCASSEPSSSLPESPSLDDGGPGSRALALASVSAATALFLFTRLAGAEPALSQLAAESVPYDVAMADTRPSMVEFYADWCEVCREMARDVQKVETRFKDKVNFVMINVDDPRYTEELDEFGVDGIPHFVFLDKDMNEQGFVVGRLPRRILSENLVALANGADAVPHSQVVGAFSEASEASDASISSPDVSVASPADASQGLPSSSASLALAASETEAQSLHDFVVENIKGERVSLGEYRGRVALVVNVASKCGLTDSNYRGLTQLYSKYKDQGFEVLAFPCNQFLRQEPGSNAEIENFACSRYKATYPLFSKIDVNGPNTAPVYKFLKSQKGNGVDVSWNFEKFLVDKEGRVVGRYSPYTNPMDLEEDVKALL